MGKSCLYIPRKGADTFRQLKQNFGYQTAAKVFNRVVTEDFLEEFGDSLALDSEGIPTYSSLMNLPIVRNYIGESTILEALNKNAKQLPNTIDNVNTLVHDAAQMNVQDKNHVAIVDYVDEDTLTIRVLPNTKENQEIARTQLAIQELNSKIAEVLGSAGVTTGHMSTIEVAVGKVGETNFAHAKSIADEFTGLIRVANSMEGQIALSEEFSHLLVGVYRDSNLMQRALNYLKNPDAAQEVLGDKYDEYLEEYRGDMELVAEEALGHMLRDQFLNKPSKVPLFGRIKNYITGFFKGINPGKYQDSIDNIQHELSKFAQDIITRKKPLTKEQIEQATRDKKFNALSERGKKQLKTLRDISARLHKEASFTQNTQDGSERADKKKLAIEATNQMNRSIVKEETMEAIASLLDTSLGQLEEAFTKLGNLDDMEMQDKFVTLRNALYTLQSYGRTIDELYSVLGEEFLEDPDILSQHFMLQDQADSLKEFRTKEPVTSVDTKNMTQSEIAAIIVQNSSELELSKDGSYYVNKKTGAKYMRATQVIQAYFEGHTFDSNSPWVKPSTNIGTGIDELVRDFMSGRITFNKDTDQWEVEGESLDKVYPNATNEQLNKFVSQLRKLKKSISDSGVTLISRDVTIEGTVDTTDGKGKTHKIQVAGTLDLLGYDEDGNWYIYDMKTHRSTMDQDTKDKYARQVSLYKKLLEDKYGITIKSLNIIPIKVNYPAPKGTTAGTAKYTVKRTKPAKYNGKESNQLIKDGQEFRGANPFLEETFSLEEIDSNISYRKLANDPTNGTGDAKNTILQALADVNSQFKMLEDRFYKESLDAFVSFLVPFMGETMEISDGKGGLKTVPLKEVVEKSGRDITMMQRLFTTMADNPDGLLQAFDKVVKVQKAEQRLNTIEMSQRILALGKEYEAKGVTDYNWMFEEGNQRYITKLIIDDKDYSYDKSAYEKASKLYTQSLDKTYGEHPEIGSPQYKAKRKAQLQWVKDNTEVVVIDGVKTTIPNHKKYPSKYSSLNNTKKEFYDKWMLLKNELDALLPNGATTLTNTIKIRKGAAERFVSLVKKGDFKGIIEEAKSSYMRSFDDAYNYNGIVGLDDEEVLTLPLYYIKSQDGDDLTHDVIGSLIAYADMAYNYQAMKEIANPLEIGKNWVMNKRDISKTQGGRGLLGTSKAGGRSSTVEGKVDPKKSKFGALLNDFFESKIYEKYLVDNGEIGGVDVNKAAGILLKLGSAIQLGFNELAHMANLGTGIAMQNIEAAAGQYFSARELAAADKEFFGSLGEYVGDIGQRAIHSKLALFDEMFNVKQDFRRNQKNKDFLNKTILGRVFGPRIQFLGQDAGDFWLYNRAAIAMAKRLELKDKNGNTFYLVDSKTKKKISLWDALEVQPINKEHPEYGNKLVIKEGVTKEDGSEFTRADIGAFERRVGNVNRHLFGVYNDEDSIAVRRTLWGRFIMQYRDWIPSQFRYRFGVMTVNQDSNERFEGYYRTTAKFIWGLRQELKNGEKNLTQIWNELDDFQKANIKRAIAEVSQLACVNFLCWALSTKSKDKDRAWVEKALRAFLLRERTELGALTIGLQMPREMVNIIKSPVAASSIIQDVVDLGTVLNPVEWTDEIQSGDYKGHSSAYRSFMRSPLTLWYRNIKKTMDPEVMERYYENLK